MSNCITFCCTTPAFVLSCRKKEGPTWPTLRPCGSTWDKTCGGPAPRPGSPSGRWPSTWGVSRPTYTYYETGHTAPSVFDLYRLAQLYGRPMEDFLR